MLFLLKPIDKLKNVVYNTQGVKKNALQCIEVN